MLKDRYVAYLRVSTDRQGRSGLGLEAQRSAVADHLKSCKGQLLAEVVEIESGKRNDRPKLAEAIALCRAHRAKLVIAKLDRLARNVAFVSNLMESGTDFVACDMPTANKLTIHIIAAMAEYEREMISTRTKQALAAAKARGTKLGGFRGRAGSADDTARARQAKSLLAAQKATALQPILSRINIDGTMSLQALARKLNAEEVPTPSGRGKWTATSISRLTAKLKTV